MKIGLTPEQFKLFENDARYNCIVVGGRCANNCIFCSCEAQAAVGYSNFINWISTDDLYKVLPLINENSTIFFGEGINFLSCEPFAHPNYTELLKILDERFPHTRKITTSVCKGLSYDRLREIRDSKLTFVAGINTFDPESRKKIMKSKDDLESVVRTLKVCKQSIFKTSLLYTGDLDTLKRDVNILYEIDPDYIEKIPTMLRLTDWSVHHKSAVKELHDYSKKTWSDAVKYIEDNIKFPSYWMRDLDEFPDTRQSIEVRKQFDIAADNFIVKYRDQLSTGQVAILLSESVYSYFVNRYPKLSSISIMVKNETFGGSYVVSSLLSKDDVLKAVRWNPTFDKYLLHRSFFHSDGKDIAGQPFMEQFKNNNIEFFG